MKDRRLIVREFAENVRWNFKWCFGFYFFSFPFQKWRNAQLKLHIRISTFTLYK